MGTAPEFTPDVIVVGVGAAGLYAAIHAGRSGARVLALDGARTLGAKILVAGGGRCNVTHYAVDEKAYAGSSPNAIRKVLRRYGVSETVEFFNDMGVRFKQEETGKLFPTTDRARTVLDALLRAAEQAGVLIKFPRRVEAIRQVHDGFEVSGDWGEARAPRLILATGGKALPKSGSDGLGYDFARALGHTIGEHVCPALVPLILPGGHQLRDLSGIAVEATLTLRSGTGKVLKAFTNSLLCTHFGLSGPCALDVSRYWRAARIDDPGSSLRACFLPGTDEAALDARVLANPKSTPLALLRGELPDRFLRGLCELAGVDPQEPLGRLNRETRLGLVRACVGLDLSIEGDRGFTHAEVTMGGIPLREVRLETMESRVCPGLHLIGEILDVDGRIGGFNFQWAWSTGYIAGTSVS
jgi:predicted Rossmann fold flavoprotein